MSLLYRPTDDISRMRIGIMRQTVTEQTFGYLYCVLTQLQLWFRRPTTFNYLFRWTSHPYEKVLLQLGMQYLNLNHDFFSLLSASSCHQEFSSDGTKHGTLTSPHYPSPYPPNTHCHYEFFGRGKERVRLVFQDFYLHKSTDGSSEWVFWSRFCIHYARC